MLIFGKTFDNKNSTKKLYKKLNDSVNDIIIKICNIKNTAYINERLKKYFFDNLTIYEDNYKNIKQSNKNYTVNDAEFKMILLLSEHLFEIGCKLDKIYKKVIAYEIDITDDLNDILKTILDTNDGIKNYLLRIDNSFNFSRIKTESDLKINFESDNCYNSAAHIYIKKIEVLNDLRDIINHQKIMIKTMGKNAEPQST